MDVHFLGTSSAIPSHGRHLPAVLIKIGTELLLIDCGDGTQFQLLKSPFKLNKITKVLISHLHGDHFFGLPAILSSFYFQNAASQIQVFGEPALKTFIELADQVGGAKRNYNFFPIADGFTFADTNLCIEARKLDHRIDCYGFAISEQPKAGPLLIDKLTALKIPPGRIYGQLKNKEDVRLENGEILRWKSFLGPPPATLKIAYCTDTKRTPNLYKLAQDADLLICESTYGKEKKELAQKYFHLTALDAIQVASKCNVKNLALVHFSSRYKDPAEVLTDIEIPANLNVTIGTEGKTIHFDK